MAKIKHIAMSVPDPEATADFYCEAFDMKRCGTTDSPLAKGCYVTDGEITVALLKYKSDEWSGYVKGEDERGKDYVGLHHIGFLVDDLKDAESRWKTPAASTSWAGPTASCRTPSTKRSTAIPTASLSKYPIWAGAAKTRNRPPERERTKIQW
jgi:hypothetical protein